MESKQSVDAACLKQSPITPEGGQGADWGDFSPPDDFDHGVEFQPEIPRPIPQHVRRGPYAQRRRASIYTLTMVGCACFLLSSVPFVNELAYYILPLQFLQHIGIGLVVIGAFACVRNGLTAGSFEYVRYGVPQVGRLRQIVVGASGNGNVLVADTGVVLHVEVEYIDPPTRKLVQTVISTDRLPRMKESDRYSLDVQAGAYVTLVSLRERDSGELCEGTLKLYGLLSLDPDRDYLRKNGKPILPVSPLIVFLIIVGIQAAMLLLLTFIYAIEFCMPIDDGDWRVAVAGLVLGAVAGLVFGRGVIRRAKQAIAAGDTAPYQKHLRLWPFPVVGTLASVLVVIVLNAVLDTSPPEYRPVVIENYWQTTHEFVIRNYSIEYREFGANETRKHPSKVREMDTFRATNLGAIDVANGRFGAKWVRGLHPLIWIRRAAEVPAGTHGITFAEGHEEAPPTQIIPVIQLPDGRTLLAPQPLADKAIELFMRDYENRRGQP